MSSGNKSPTHPLEQIQKNKEEPQSVNAPKADIAPVKPPVGPGLFGA